MAKPQKIFFCQNCGASHSKWMGQCSHCGEWNTIAEELVKKEKGEAPNWQGTPNNRQNQAQLIGEGSREQRPRLACGDPELDRTLGGGIVSGSVSLLGGEPGIGKSTLMLQLALSLPVRCLYVSGEESAEQVRLRAQRIGLKNDQCYLLTATDLREIFRQVAEVQPTVLIVDSVQTLHSVLLDSAPGTVSQIRQCAAELIQFAKESDTAVFLIGHITKEGNLAGPKILEHMVDTVLLFEGDRQHAYRLLRAQKNRFGSTHEIGIYEMFGEGLRGVKNPSEILLGQREGILSGNAIAATVEGMRPMLIEVQALCSTAVYGTPQRSATGYDVRRLNMLLAVLEKRCGFKLGQKDVFLNITGGLKVNDPALDLAIVAAILSSNEDLPLSPRICFAAEVGLSGEVRPVARSEQRIAEAEKMGLEEIIVSSHSKNIPAKSALKIHRCAKIEEVFQLLFG